MLGTEDSKTSRLFLLLWGGDSLVGTQSSRQLLSMGIGVIEYTGKQRKGTCQSRAFRDGSPREGGR